MNIKNLFAITLTLFLFTTGNQMQAKAKSIEKVFFDQGFPVQSMANLIINQETGSITCENWDKNEISVKLTAVVETNNRDLAEKEFNRVIWNITGNSKEVSVNCKLAPKRNNKNKINVHLKLEILMPRQVNFYLKQKYGDAFVATVDGTANITSQYGSINVNALNAAENKFKVDYGAGHINRFESGDIYINYSGFSLYSTKNTGLISKYSEIKINKAGTLQLQLEGGSMNMDSVGRFQGTVKYSTINIRELANTMSLNTSYGNISVSLVHNGFEELSVINKYGTVNLNISENSTYSIEAEMEYCTLNYPEPLARFNYRVKTTNSSVYRGIIGNGTAPGSKVNIQSKYGNVNLKAK